MEGFNRHVHLPRVMRKSAPRLVCHVLSPVYTWRTHDKEEGGRLWTDTESPAFCFVDVAMSDTQAEMSSGEVNFPCLAQVSAPISSRSEFYFA